MVLPTFQYCCRGFTNLKKVCILSPQATTSQGEVKEARRNGARGDIFLAFQFTPLRSYWLPISAFTVVPQVLWRWQCMHLPLALAFRDLVRGRTV